MSRYLITGGSGYFGSVLVEYLLSQGHECINVDICPQIISHESLKTFEIDIRNYEELKNIFESCGPFDSVFHLAAMLAHSVKDKKALMETNVLGTENVVKLCAEFGIKNLVFTSSNCLWAKPFGRPVTEEDKPEPVEVYGLSKMKAEEVLFNYADRVNSAILRVPTIISSGRLGLLAILFEFIEENRIVWMVGKGENHYQFIYGPDLAQAALLASTINHTRIYNVGSDQVKSLKEIYRYVIDRAGSKSKIKHLPRVPAILAMKIAHFLKLSPLGPYHYKMIAESFEFDTSRIKNELGWKPTKTNEEMLFEAFLYYKEHKDEIQKRQMASAHRKPAEMGIIKLLKWLS
ncbi:MAG: NAD(P)-dependent oxidoreductase [Candidatus Aminicenantes bacterium]|nr:NAD(P)-dependent oxidoreductase [Candidatus Aminicenantes bacterium]